MSGPYDAPDGSYEGVDDEYWLTRGGLYPQAIMAMACRLTSDEATHTCPIKLEAATHLIGSSLTFVLAYLLLSY